jgi:lysozyme
VKTSEIGIALITEFEGFPNGGRPYNDPVGLATVGYGHLIARRRVNDSDRRARWLAGQRTPGVLTLAEGRALLAADLAAREAAVDAMVTVALTQGQFDALVSLAFNIGEGNLRSSTVLRRLNQREVRGAADAFMMWNKAGVPLQVLGGLTRRRKAERARFLAGGGPGPKAPVVRPRAGNFTPAEEQWIDEFDRLAHAHRNPDRRERLRAEMTLQRKRIWRRAQPVAKGGDGRGWEYGNRRERYHALLQRTN